MITLDALLILQSGRKIILEGNHLIVYQSSLPSGSSSPTSEKLRSLVIFPDCALQQEPIPGTNVVRLYGLLHEAPPDLNSLARPPNEKIDFLIVSRESHPRSFPSISPILLVPTFHISGLILHLTHKEHEWVTLEGYRSSKSWYIGVRVEHLHAQSRAMLQVGSNVSVLGTFFQHDTTTDGSKPLLVFHPLFIDTLEPHSHLTAISPPSRPKVASGAASTFCATASAYGTLEWNKSQAACTTASNSASKPACASLEEHRAPEKNHPTLPVEASQEVPPPDQLKSSPVLSETRKRSRISSLTEESDDEGHRLRRSRQWHQK